MRTKIILLLAFILSIVLLFSILPKGEKPQPVIPILERNTVGASLTDTILSFVTVQKGWPPVIETSNTRYVCTRAERGGGRSAHNITSKYYSETFLKTINNVDYCETVDTKESSLNIFRTYTYTTKQDSNKEGIKFTTFTLRFDNCSKYGNVNGAVSYNARECMRTEGDFVDKLDTIIASLMHK